MKLLNFKTNKNIIAAVVLSAVSLTSCNGWLTEPAPGITKLEDFFSNGQTAIQATTAAYVPLMWEYNGTYFSEWFIGDVMSDDALKGGQTIGDMADVYDLENWKTNTNNGVALEYYRAQYQGIGRCNLALDQIPNMSTDTVMNESVQKRLIGELHYLRAYYYFRLVRTFGGVPKIDFVILSADKWQQPRATAEEIYDFIIEDLKIANQNLWHRSEYSSSDLGRATKGAAQAMLLKANLYTQNYQAAKAWGDSIISSNEYDLVPNFFSNYTLAGENSIESVFEIQYMEEATSDYGEGNGFSRGSYTPVLTRSRSSQLGGGWGFNKPTQNLYNAFEANDPRRDLTILNPTDAQIDNPEEEIYLGSRYLNRKIMWIELDGTIPGLAHNSRGPLNNKQIRYADVLLMYAEAACETGDLAAAKSALEQVRARARNLSSAENVLPEFPYGNYSDNQDDLRKAIRQERRTELAMEGHRWFDICRWGIAKEVMDAYKATETAECRAQMAEFIKGKHELLPIPSKEIELNPMTQNPGY